MPSKTSTSFIPTQHNLSLYAGDGAELRMSVTTTETAPDPSDPPVQVPFPIDGEVTAQIRVQRVDTTHIVDFVVDDAEFDDGIISLALSGEQTQSLVDASTSRDKIFNGQWDVQLVQTGSEPITLVQGTVKCQPDVTRED